MAAIGQFLGCSLSADTVLLLCGHIMHAQDL